MVTGDTAARVNTALIGIVVAIAGFVGVKVWNIDRSVSALQAQMVLVLAGMAGPQNSEVLDYEISAPSSPRTVVLGGSADDRDRGRFDPRQ